MLASGVDNRQTQSGKAALECIVFNPRLYWTVAGFRNKPQFKGFNVDLSLSPSWLHYIIFRTHNSSSQKLHRNPDSQKTFYCSLDGHTTPHTVHGSPPLHFILIVMVQGRPDWERVMSWDLSQIIEPLRPETPVTFTNEKIMGTHRWSLEHSLC